MKTLEKIINSAKKIAKTSLLVGALTGTLSLISLKSANADDVNDFKQHCGVNLPWINYGWDLGENPWGGAPGGYNANRKRLVSDFDYLKSKNVKLCRVFLFCDYRTGLKFDGNGNVIGIDDYVDRDMETLLEVAQARNIKIIPVLHDYMIADGVEHEGASKVGEYPYFITNTEKKKQLFENVLRPFIRKYGAHNAVYAWDIINEPKFAVAVKQDEMKNFITELANLIHNEIPNAKVTVGTNKRADVGLWDSQAVDIVQFHYYDDMEKQYPLDFPASSVSNKPVLIGEMQPTNVKSKLETALKNDYAGVLFWSLNADYDFRAVADEFRNWIGKEIGNEINSNGNSGGNPGTKSESSGSGGCFIATAVYGTPMAEEVKVLSQFKNEHLMKNPFGRLFVDMYYILSPQIADKIKEDEASKQVIRKGLGAWTRVLKKSKKSLDKNLLRK